MAGTALAAASQVARRQWLAANEAYQVHRGAGFLAPFAKTYLRRLAHMEKHSGE